MTLHNKSYLHGHHNNNRKVAILPGVPSLDALNFVIKEAIQNVENHQSGISVAPGFIHLGVNDRSQHNTHQMLFLTHPIEDTPHKLERELLELNASLKGRAFVCLPSVCALPQISQAMTRSPELQLSVRRGMYLTADFAPDSEGSAMRTVDFNNINSKNPTATPFDSIALGARAQARLIMHVMRPLPVH